MSALDPFTVLKAEPKPAPPPATIRPFAAATDLKVARYMVGSGIMEPSSLANLHTLWTPFCLLVWAVSTHLLVERVGRGWPTSLRMLLAGEGFEAARKSLPLLQALTEWLATIPLLVTPPIVMLASFELRHRNRFEDEMSRAIGEEDMRDIEGYYATDDLSLDEGAKKGVAAQGGRKGFWVYEYDGRIIGAVSLDGRKPGKALDSVVDLPPVVPGEDKKIEGAAPEASTTSTAATDSPYPLRNRKSKTPATEAAVAANSFTETTYTDTLQIRRLATSLSFRPAGTEDDLLQFVANFAFSPGAALPPAKRITIALRPVVQKSLASRLKKNGFKLVARGAAGELHPDEAKLSNATATGVLASISSLLDSVWPLDLGWKTYALDRDDWASAQKA